MANKQCICPTCGKVAEIRRQKTGKQLRYMVCKDGHGGLMTRKDADKWEQIEQDHIGTFGELPPSAQNDVAQVDDVTKVATVEPYKADDFVPASEDLPENAEPVLQKVQKETDGKTVEESPPDAEEMTIGTKIGLGVLALLGVGGALYALKKRAGGA